MSRKMRLVRAIPDGVVWICTILGTEFGKFPPRDRVWGDHELKIFSRGYGDPTNICWIQNMCQANGNGLQNISCEYEHIKMKSQKS